MFRVGIRSVCVMGFLGVEVSAGDRPAVFRILRGELGLAVAAWQVLTWAQRRSARMPEFQGAETENRAPDRQAAAMTSAL